MATSSVGMDQETALELLKRGSTLLLLDVPQFTLLGIDTQVFSVGPKFKGIKMIPPGPHFVYYNPSNKEGNEFSPTTGFFIVTHPSEVIVRKWHQQEERLVSISEDEETRYSEAVQRFEFDQQLGPYALEQFAKWRQLSGYITKETIERIGRVLVLVVLTGSVSANSINNGFNRYCVSRLSICLIEPIGGEITIVYESGLIEKNSRTALDKQLVEQLRDSKFSKCAAEKVEKKGCYYKDIPHVIKQKDITGGELTSLNLDKTSLLETILMKDYEGAEDLFLGELQFAFVAFMLGQSLEGFLQWKALVSLLFSCTEAPLRTRTQLFTKFIRVVYFQLKHSFDKQNQGNNAGKGILLSLDDTMFSKDIFLFRLCKEFFPLVLESHGVDGDLFLWTRKLKGLLETAFGWEFKDNADVMCEEENDEFSPVIVPPNEAIPSEDRAT